MPDDRERASRAGLTADAAFRLLVMQKIAHDLTMLFEVEPQTPPELQTLLRKLRDQE
jgi:hypothetical protein